jgi:hypothetical protein
MRVVDVTLAAREVLPPVCRTCAWWQTGAARRAAAAVGRRAAGQGPGDVPSPDDPASLRADWERRVTDAAGTFGKALVDDEAVLGWMQAAPAPLVPRAKSLPAGPPSADAWLITCVYLYDEEYLQGFQRLINELQADLKRREVAALEAFALCATLPADRFRGYLREINLFNHETLEGSGFRPVRLVGDVVRYRLELAGLVAEPRLARVKESLESLTAAQPV